MKRSIFRSGRFAESYELIYPTEDLLTSDRRKSCQSETDLCFSQSHTFALSTKIDIFWFDTSFMPWRRFLRKTVSIHINSVNRRLDREHSNVLDGIQRWLLIVHWRYYCSNCGYCQSCQLDCVDWLVKKWIEMKFDLSTIRCHSSFLAGRSSISNEKMGISSSVSSVQWFFRF